MMAEFQLESKYSPTGDQPKAIKKLREGIESGKPFQTLLGITGSGKTYTIAKLIEAVQKPTMIISHNKTLAAQLYGEFKSFFPNNAVEYFISYYDYYQPEAYLPVTDTYIEKDSDINDEIEKLRLKATSSLMARKDVIVVASVSSIFGLGSPEDYKNQIIVFKKGETIDRKALMKSLVKIHYNRNDMAFARSTFRIRGDVIEIFPAYADNPIRLEFWGEEIDAIHITDPVTGISLEELEFTVIYPARHFVTNEETLNESFTLIRRELEERLNYFRSEDKLIEAQRLEQRTEFDLEMIKELGFCSGIENYSRHLTMRKAGQRPFTLFDFFPKDYLLIIDESHATIPQVRAMYNGDFSRKRVLVEYGFRLPSAHDNRPMKFEEFENLIKQCVFVSATPSDYELEKCDGEVVEQIIRPTGLLDPEIVLHPSKNQIDHLISEIRKRVERKERVLVTTLTKKMAENLADYLKNNHIRVRYMHSEINSLERISILRDLRIGTFDVLVGINLLREGLDLPEVSLVAILDADKQGFLRSERSLFQISGRAARNDKGRVIFYADKITPAMKKVMDETIRRREIQKIYNDKHGIQPVTIYKTLEEINKITTIADVNASYQSTKDSRQKFDMKPKNRLEALNMVDQLTIEMEKAAEQLDFEKAAAIRDDIMELKKRNKI
ncbi:MAG: excinuclease ABC subunit UvrB [Candidatus Marinimicrobia bacterium]|nr:excinuclease ABC subunit UvrB [Candidatus Neomarinimicrobiota bacterium]